MKKAKQKIIIDPMVSPINLNGQKKDSDPSQSENLNEPEKHPIGKISDKDFKKGVSEGQNEIIKKETQSEEKLKELVEKTTKVLYKARNIIPLLTGEVIIDTAKVTLIYRPFFFSERIHSVAVKDITDIYLETVPFFATLIMIDSGFVDHGSLNNTANSVVKMNWLRKNEAERARRIITGLMETNKEGVDITMVHDEDLATKLEEIGKVRETVTSVSNA